MLLLLLFLLLSLLVALSKKPKAIFIFNPNSLPPSLFSLAKLLAKSLPTNTLTLDGVRSS